MFGSISYLVFYLITVVRMAEPFPDSVAGFGYAFNEDGQLRKIDPETQKPGDEKFEFTVTPDRSYNQKRYEALGELLTEHIYTLLETTCGLERLVLPKDGPPEESSFIFASPDLSTNTDKLLILIHGAGVVRAGQWARSLVINHSLKAGTQIPTIQQAKQLGYAVLVLNTNDNKRNRQEIEGSGQPEEHSYRVWQDYVRSSPAKHVAIIAHSYGGLCTIALAEKFMDEFQARVFAIALTDSVHYLQQSSYHNGVLKHLREVGRIWVASDKPLDTPIVSDSSLPSITKVSAGHTDHATTTYSSHESVFKFIEKRYQSLKSHETQPDDESVEAGDHNEETCIDALTRLTTEKQSVVDKEL